MAYKYTATLHLIPGSTTTHVDTTMITNFLRVLDNKIAGEIIAQFKLDPDEPVWALFVYPQHKMKISIVDRVEVVNTEDASDRTVISLQNFQNETSFVKPEQQRYCAIQETDENKLNCIILYGCPGLLNT